MARRIIWATIARQQLKDIILYWNKRNKSRTYSKKLRKHLKSILKLLVLNPEIGKKTNYRDKKVRSKTFMRDFQIIYGIPPFPFLCSAWWWSIIFGNVSLPKKLI